MLFASLWSRVLVGGISGVMGAMFGMPGPPVVLFGINVLNDKKEYLATLQAFWLLFNLVYLCFRSGGGYYSSCTPFYFCIGVAGVFVGLFLGARCFAVLNGKAFKMVVYLLMLASGIVAFFR